MKSKITNEERTQAWAKLLSELKAPTLDITFFRTGFMDRVTKENMTAPVMKGLDEGGDTRVVALLLDYTKVKAGQEMLVSQGVTQFFQRRDKVGVWEWCCTGFAEMPIMTLFDRIEGSERLNPDGGWLYVDRYDGANPDIVRKLMGGELIEAMCAKHHRETLRLSKA